MNQIALTEALKSLLIRWPAQEINLQIGDIRVIVSNGAIFADVLKTDEYPGESGGVFTDPALASAKITEFMTKYPWRPGD